MSSLVKLLNVLYALKVSEWFLEYSQGQYFQMVTSSFGNTLTQPYLNKNLDKKCLHTKINFCGFYEDFSSQMLMSHTNWFYMILLGFYFRPTSAQAIIICYYAS